MNSPSPSKRKPWVFLSHSSCDKEFIEQVSMALKRFEIEPWLDSEEIRHGQPWLDAIFENGIPNCDCTLIYLTESSLQSAMVKKEIDASVLQKLKDKGVGFLPYVSSEEIREHLRSDIRAMQAPVWNVSNFDNLLPRVVAEIWRSFSERTSLNAARDERMARLEAELELMKLKEALSGEVFSETESRDLSYIWTKLDRFDELVVLWREKRTPDDTWTTDVHLVNVGSVLWLAIKESPHHFADYQLQSCIGESPRFVERYKDKQVRVKRALSVENELLRYGLTVVGGVRTVTGDPGYTYTPKMRRLEYWLESRGLLPQEIKWSPGPLPLESS